MVNACARAAVCLAALLALGGCSSWQKTWEDIRGGSIDRRPYATLEGTRWLLNSAMLRSGPVLSPDPRRYWIEFQPEHRLLVRADCNRGLGAWKADADSLSIGSVSYTRAVCEVSSVGAEFSAALETARSWYLRDGSLFLELTTEGRVLRFNLADPAAR